jgi:hypothetical protein
MRVTIEHFRAVPGFGSTPGFCVSGGRAWFKANGLDWREFVRHGIEIERLEAIGDCFCRAIVAHARKEATRGR